MSTPMQGHKSRCKSFREVDHVYPVSRIYLIRWEKQQKPFSLTISLVRYFDHD